MTEQMTSAEAAAIADRMPRPGSGYGPSALKPPSEDEIAAGRLAALIKTGDRGAVLHLVNELEHQRGTTVTVSPWRLIELLAAGAIDAVDRARTAQGARRA